MDLEQNISYNPISGQHSIEVKSVEALTSFNPQSTKLYVNVELNSKAKL